MYFKSICALVVVFVCASSISTVEAINCYQCNSHIDPDCADLAAHKPHKVAGFYQPCEKDSDGDEPFCRIISYKFKFKAQREDGSRVVRSCGFKRSQKACYKADNDHHLEEVCQCFEDGCNSATNLPVFSSVTISFVAATIYYMF